MDHDDKIAAPGGDCPTERGPRLPEPTGGAVGFSSTHPLVPRPVSGRPTDAQTSMNTHELNTQSVR